MALSARHVLGIIILLARRRLAILAIDLPVAKYLRPISAAAFSSWPRCAAWGNFGVASTCRRNRRRGIQNEQLAAAAALALRGVGWLLAGVWRGVTTVVEVVSQWQRRVSAGRILLHRGVMALIDDDGARDGDMA